MRADVLEGNVAPLDVFSNTPRRWPQGNIYYVYGSFFMQWLIETYGEGALRRMIDDYGSQLVPYGVNRSVKRATGRTFEDMYPAFVDTLRREFTAQRDAIFARGLREGRRVTFGGYTAEHPRWIPANAWEGRGGDLLYFRDDADDRVGFYALPVVRDADGQVVSVNDRARKVMIRTNGDGSASFTPDGAVVFSQTEVTDNLFNFNDLSYLPRGETSETGLDGRRTRLTTGFRAVDPDVSPDGRRVAFATNHRGTTYLENRRPQPFGPVEAPHPRAKRPVRSGLHAALVARQHPRRLQRLDAWRLPGRSDRRHARRIVRCGHPGPCPRPGPVVLGGRQDALLHLGPYRRHERVRVRRRGTHAPAGNERRERRLLPGGVTRRQDPCVHWLHGGRFRSVRHAPRPRQVPAGAALRGHSRRSASRSRSPRLPGPRVPPARYPLSARVHCRSRSWRFRLRGDRLRQR